MGLVLVDWVLEGLEYDCPRRVAPGDSREAGVVDVAVDMSQDGLVNRSWARQRATRPLIFKIATTPTSPGSTEPKYFAYCGRWLSTLCWGDPGGTGLSGGRQCILRYPAWLVAKDGTVRHDKRGFQGRAARVFSHYRRRMY